MTTLAQAYQEGWDDAMITLAARLRQQAIGLTVHPPFNPYAEVKK